MKMDIAPEVIQLEHLVGPLFTETPPPGSLITRCDILKHYDDFSTIPLQRPKSLVWLRSKQLSRSLRILLKFEPHLKLSLEDVPAFLTGIGLEWCVPLIGDLPWHCLFDVDDHNLPERGVSTTLLKILHDISRALRCRCCTLDISDGNNVTNWRTVNIHRMQIEPHTSVTFSRNSRDPVCRLPVVRLPQRVEAPKHTFKSSFN